jgi:hypothetical protein
MKFFLVLLFLPVISAYICVDNFTVQTFTNFSTYKISFLPDPVKAVYSFEVMFSKIVIKIKQKLSIYTKEDENDLEISHLLISMVVDTCKISQGVLPTVIVRSIFKDKNYLNSVMTCPFKKNYWYRYTNLTVTDELLPPIPTEMKFKLRLQSFGIYEGKKSWNSGLELNVTGRIKKEVFRLN